MLHALGLVHGSLTSAIPHVDAATQAYPGRRSKKRHNAENPSYPLEQKRSTGLAHKHSLDDAAVPV